MTKGRKIIVDEYAELHLTDEYIGKSKKYMTELRARLRRKAKGLCDYSGCKELATRMCPKHREVLNKLARERRAKKSTSTKEIVG